MKKVRFFITSDFDSDNLSHVINDFLIDRELVDIKLFCYRFDSTFSFGNRIITVIIYKERSKR